MLRERFLPIKRIKKKSRIVLYGAGQNGRRYWEQNCNIEWCNIVCVVDRKNGYKSEFGPWIYPLSELANVEYDSILISVVDRKLQGEIINELTGLGVLPEKIIYSIDEFYCWNEEEVKEEVNDKRSKDDIYIAYLATGSMGDCIISLKMYQTIVELCNEKCRIDIYSGDEKSLKYTYYGQKCLSEIIPGFTIEGKYDLAIRDTFEPILEFWDKEKIQRLAPKLADALLKLEFYQINNRVKGPDYQFNNRVAVDRARFLGLNRYTLYGISGAFDIKDQSVKLYKNPDYYSVFKALGLKKRYITYNFGAKDQFNDGRKQTKMWPVEYHEKLNLLIKERFPEIQLIQLGGGNAEKIPGADLYLFGLELGVVEYILEQSIIHFDCEGGLVHMATQLGTKCCVVFGPTPVWFMGYEKNLNIAPKKCGECKGLTKEWYTTCIKYDKPECMYSITPEYVLEKLSTIIEAEEL